MIRPFRTIIARMRSPLISGMIRSDMDGTMEARILRMPRYMTYLPQDRSYLARRCPIMEVQYIVPSVRLSIKVKKATKQMCS